MTKDKSIEKLQEEIKVLEKRVQENLAGWQRAKADYINLKKETEEKMKQVAGFSQAAVILEFLPILDHFNQAVEHIPEEQKTEAWVQGIGHIKKQMEDLIKAKGIEPIETIGKIADPKYHEVIGTEQKEGAKEDEIIKQVNAGYIINGEVLNPAKVIVNSKSK